MKPLKSTLFIASVVGLGIVFAAVLGWWVTVMLTNFKVVSAPPTGNEAVPTLLGQSYLDILQGK